MKHLPLLLLLPLEILFSCNKGTPPVAAFTVTPESGNTSTEFILDPSASSDAESAKEDLRCRWDWNNDGIWETGYASLDAVIHQFDIIGLTEVKLEVIDEDGLSGTATKEISLDASGASGSFFDSRDNQKYKWVRIGSQVWMAQNLNYKTETNSYCYGDKEVNCQIYGRLYNWEITIDNNHGNGRDICPAGWHLPTDEEFKVLEMAAGMSEFDANYISGRGWIAAKLRATTGWGIDNNGTNETGFSVLPSGFLGDHYKPEYMSLGSSAHFWLADEQNFEAAWHRGFTSGPQIDRIFFYKDYGFSVRCIKNEE